MLRSITHLGVTPLMDPQLEKRIVLTNELCLVSTTASVPYLLYMLALGLPTMAVAVGLL